MGAKVKVIKKVDGRIDRRNGGVINRLLRVTAYARVSTDDEDQKNSYESQLLFFKSKIKENQDWIYVDMYSDEAISGTLDYKRSDFMKMINDALSGKIDMILTKSISRFARNTVDTLKYVRMLKEKNIAVYFVEENINTLEMSSEFVLTILSSVAQQESENISNHVKLGFKAKMERGELIGFNGCLGYDYDRENHSITINEEEKKIVKYIYNRYLQGVGATIIAKELTDLGVETKLGNVVWSDSSVRKILKNVKYKGDVIQGLTFTVDPISHKRMINMGEVDQYYTTNNHEAIISEETWSKVQEIMKSRAKPGERQATLENKYAFSGKIKCAFCGRIYSRKTWGQKDNLKVGWNCVSSIKHGKENCPNSKGIPEQVLQQCFITVHNELLKNNKNIVDNFFNKIEKLLTKYNVNSLIEDLKDKKENCKKQIEKLVEKNLNGIIDDETYTKKRQELEDEIKKCEKRIEKAISTSKSEEKVKERVQTMRKNINSNNELINEFEDNSFKCMVKEIIVGGYNKDESVNPFALKFILNSDNIGTNTIDKENRITYIDETLITELNAKVFFEVFNVKENGYKRKDIINKIHIKVCSDI